MSDLAWAWAALNRTGLPALPHDVLLEIYALLDVSGAVAVAKTCRSLHAFASSRAAWLTLARTLAVSKALALPTDKQLTTVPAQFSTDEMRTAVQHTVRLAATLDKPHPSLISGLALALPEATTVVHTSLLPGGRFLLTAQQGGTFACWDLAVTEPVSSASHPSGLPRRRSMRTQTHSADGVDVEMGSESDDEFDAEPSLSGANEGLRRPRCVATWETGAEYVEFAFDLVPGGVVVALMVAIQVGHNPPVLKRDLYVVRIDLPTSTTPPAHSPFSSPPSNPGLRTTSASGIPAPFAGHHHGLAFIAHSPLRHPVFIATTFINAAGHAGVLGDIPATMVLFVLLFDPNQPVPTTTAPTLTQPSPSYPVHCASTLVHCGFKCTPGTRHTALSTSTHAILYAESPAKAIAHHVDVRPLRRRWLARAPTPGTHTECLDLGVKLLGSSSSRNFAGSPGTEGSPFFTTVRAMLRRQRPKWLEREDRETRGVPRRVEGNRYTGKRASRSTSSKPVRKEEPVTVSVMGLSVDQENRTTDVYQGMALGSHDIECVDDEDEDAEEETSNHSWATTATTSDDTSRRGAADPAGSYHLPTPSQASLIKPTPSTTLDETESPSTSTSTPAPAPTPIPIPPLHRPFRRAHRIRYKRTIFPAHVNYAHELAGMGSFGRYAAWIEGDGVPEETDWAKEPLRLVLAPLTWENGSEHPHNPHPHATPDLGDANVADAEAEVAMRHRAGQDARVLGVPSGVRHKLNMVSCLALEDAVGVLAMATIDGQVYVLSLL